MLGKTAIQTISVPTEKGEPMREKLIELLCKAHGMATDASLFENASFAEQLEAEADFLIANGVNVPVGEIDFDYNAEVV
jgi:hypothetical protein